MTPRAQITLLLGLALLLLLFTAGCSQIQRKDFPAHCDFPGHYTKDGLDPGYGAAFDVSTSKVPVIVPPHRFTEVCDVHAAMHFTPEETNEAGLSGLQDLPSEITNKFTWGTSF